GECRRVGMPRAVVITKLDTEHADFDAAVESVREAFGDGVHPAYIPLRSAGNEIIGNLSLLTRRTHDYSSGSRVARDSTPEEAELIENYRADYVESIITESEDEALMESYFNGDDLPTDSVVDDLMKAMYHGTFYPVLPVMTSGVGVEELIGLINRGFPTPMRRQLPDAKTLTGDDVELGEISADGPLVAQVIKTTSDPFAGRLSLVRIFSGTLKADATVQIAGRKALFGLEINEHHPDHAETERIGALSAPAGQELVAKTQALAGELVYVGKLSKAETGDTLSSTDRPCVLRPWTPPKPLLPSAVRALSRNDEDKLAAALARLVVEDSSVQLVRQEGTDQLLLWSMGQAHSDLLMARLKDRYGVNVTTEPIKVALRETFIAPSEAQGRHVKQSGGHGQYGVCHIRVEPLERGAGFEFVDQVVGGAVPRQFIPSVEKGVRAQLEKGTISGYPMVDIRVILDDGKSHPVDSSDMAFQSAGSLALKEAAKPEKVALLEPLDDVTVTVGDEYLGAVMTDLGNRRGQLLGTDAGEPGTTVVRAIVPQSELNRYAIDLRGLARGSGSFTRAFHGYELMPPQAAAEAIKASKQES
ncbi:MAG: elongation factor G, partial [Propionibacteriaceae bacterium]|nr:elongation factor G [Propionibacteriaceae bacterium]